MKRVYPVVLALGLLGACAEQPAAPNQYAGTEDGGVDFEPVENQTGDARVDAGAAVLKTRAKWKKKRQRRLRRLRRKTRQRAR